MGEIKHPDFFGYGGFFSRIGYLAVSSLLKFIVQLAIVILYSQKLTLTEYGIYQFVWMYINFFSVMVLFGTTTLMLSTPLTSLALWIKNNKRLIALAFLALNCIAVIFLFVYGKYFTPYQNLLLVTLLFIQNVSLIAESIAIKKEQEKKLLYANLIYTLIYAIIHIYLLYTAYSISALLQFLIIATVLKSVILLYGSHLQAKDDTKHDDIGKQWLMLGINDILGVLVKWIDKWLILFFLPPAAFAVYFNGTYEIPVFMIILGAIGSVSLVDFSKIREDHGTAAKILFERSSLMMASIVFPAFWFFFFYSDDFILTLFGAKYADSIPVFKISILILPVRIIYSTTVLQVFNRTDLIVKGSILDLIIAVLLMWILYPAWGMQGLAFAFVFSTYIQVGYYLMHTGKLLQQKISYFIPFKKLAVLLFISGVISTLCSYPAHLFAPVFSLLTGLAVSGAMIFICLYFFKKTLSFKPYAS